MPAKGKVLDRRFKDPTALTPYEVQIKTLKDQGLSLSEIAVQLQQGRDSVKARWKVVREKLEVA